jgi:hypothetical protein
VRWRIGLVDSGAAPGLPLAAARFAADGTRGAVGDDLTGHGTRIARLITGGRPELELVLAQVFDGGAPTSAAAVAAGIDWCRDEGATLVHLSLGLRADRAVLADAVRRAVAAGCLVVAATPARGAPVYPAAYPDVIRATGDARCAAEEISQLGPTTFGGCVRPEAAAAGGGASVGAAAVSRALARWLRPGSGFGEAVAALAARARYDGPERRAPAAPEGEETS